MSSHYLTGNLKKLRVAPRCDQEALALRHAGLRPCCAHLIRHQMHRTIHLLCMSAEKGVRAITAHFFAACEYHHHIGMLQRRLGQPLSQAKRQRHAAGIVLCAACELGQIGLDHQGKDDQHDYAGQQSDLPQDGGLGE